MRRSIYIQTDLEQVGTIHDLTSVFEAIASIHIAKIRDKAIASTIFFNELWQVYKQLRREKGPPGVARGASHRPALIAITSEGGLIGDIDQRIVEKMLSHPDRESCDIYVIGAHGGNLMAAHGVRPLKLFHQPTGEADTDIKIRPLIALLQEYGQATVYYQTYVSLTRQNIARIDLFSAVNQLSEEANATSGEVITKREYIFEPSLEEVISYMEGVMLEIALSQVVLESRLAQFASRYNAMSRAKVKATEMRAELALMLNRAKRSQSDERTKEIVSAMKALGQSS